MIALWRVCLRAASPFTMFHLLWRLRAARVISWKRCGQDSWNRGVIHKLRRRSVAGMYLMSRPSEPSLDTNLADTAAPPRRARTQAIREGGEATLATTHTEAVAAGSSMRELSCCSRCLDERTWSFSIATT